MAKKGFSAIEDALNQTGLPWEIRPGQRHKKVFLAGRMITVFSHNNRNADKGPDGVNHTLTIIKRAARSLRCS